MPLLYPQLSSRGLRRLVTPVDELMQSERDLVRMRCTPGDNALQLNRIVSDGTYFHQLGFNDFRGSHRNLEWHIGLRTSSQQADPGLRRCETSIMIRSTLDDLPFVRHVFPPGAQRVLDRAQDRRIRRAFPSIRRLRIRRSVAGTPASFASRGGEVRPMPSASAMSVTVARRPVPSAIRVRLQL